MIGSSALPPAGADRAAGPGRRLRRLRPAAAAALLLSLAACAGAEGLPGLNPPQTTVAEVPENAFPTLGAPPVERREPLTPEAQQKLQRDLERLARTQSR